jgi:AcrR family transcriptional regulator
MLDVAERLFAANGYDGVSLRALAAAADADLGLIHYHLGGKLDLYRAVWARWFPPVDMTKPSLARPPLPKDAPLETNVRTFVDRFFGPLITLFETPRGRHMLTILGREIFDPKAASRGVLKTYLDPRASLLVDDIRALMPSLSKAEVSLAYSMMTGIASNVFVQHAHALRSLRGATKVDDMLKSLPAVIDFVVGGWMRIYESSTNRRV